MLDKIVKKFNKVYKSVVYSNRVIKLVRIFQYQKIIFQELIIQDSDKCLLLAPHPDDETFGCGGLLLKYPENFDIVCLTDGRHGGHKEETLEKLCEIRKNELEAVMAKLNISSYKSLNIPDKKLLYYYDVFKTIEIEKYNYIFIPNYFDQHKDHKAVTTLLQKYFINKTPKKNLKIVHYEIWSALGFPNYFIDISSLIEKKKELINIYASQTRYVDFLNGITSLNRYRGMLVNKEYAEFFSILDIKTFLKL